MKYTKISLHNTQCYFNAWRIDYQL